jgi:hypothetical protein
MMARTRNAADIVLGDVLAMVVPDLRRHCRDPWWVIGSVAARLIGAEVAVGDVDLLAECWKAHRDSHYFPPGEDRFRSQFARFAFPGLPVELMGGLELWRETGWEPVQVDEVAVVKFAGLALPVPSLAEQIRLLERFGRPKDQRRAALLKSLRGDKSLSLSMPCGRGSRASAVAGCHWIVRALPNFRHCVAGGRRWR